MYKSSLALLLAVQQSYTAFDWHQPDSPRAAAAGLGGYDSGTASAMSRNDANMAPRAASAAFAAPSAPPMFGPMMNLQAEKQAN